VKFIKWLLIIIGLFLLVWLGLWVVGVVSALLWAILWYGFWIGVIGAIGYGGYKLLNKGEARQLEEKPPIAIAEMRDADRALEEYKQKYLPK
jgi:hypothetical protein